MFVNPARSRMHDDVDATDHPLASPLCSTDSSGLRHPKIAALAKSAMALIKAMKCALSMPLHKLPSQPAPKFPTKLVASQAPIVTER
jgi:hypothetical protein